MIAFQWFYLARILSLCGLWVQMNHAGFVYTKGPAFSFVRERICFPFDTVIIIRCTRTHRGKVKVNEVEWIRLLACPPNKLLVNVHLSNRNHNSVPT